MIVVHASVPIDPDRREEALDLVEELVAETRAEGGVVTYHATTDVEDPNVVRFFERYEDEDALEFHTGTEHYRAWMEALPDLVENLDAIDVTQFVVEEAFDPNADVDES